MTEHPKSFNLLAYDAVRRICEKLEKYNINSIFDSQLQDSSVLHLVGYPTDIVDSNLSGFMTERLDKEVDKIACRIAAEIKVLCAGAGKDSVRFAKLEIPEFVQVASVAHNEKVFVRLVHTFDALRHGICFRLDVLVAMA